MMKPLVDRVDQNQTVTNCRLLERMGISEMTLIEMVWTNLQLAIIGCLSFSIIEFCNDNDIQLIALHGSHGHLGAHYPPNAFLLSLCEFVLIQVFKSFSIKIISVFLNFILRRFQINEISASINLLPYFSLACIFLVFLDFSRFLISMNKFYDSKNNEISFKFL